MRDKLVLRFLGFLETMKYILEQSHGVPPVSVALDHTTLKEEGSCGYSSVKTVRSIGRTINTFEWRDTVPGMGMDPAGARRKKMIEPHHVPDNNGLCRTSDFGQSAILPC